MASELALPALIGFDPAKFAAVEKKTGILDTGRSPTVGLAISIIDLGLPRVGSTCSFCVTTRRVSLQR